MINLQNIDVNDLTLVNEYLDKEFRIMINQLNNDNIGKYYFEFLNSLILMKSVNTRSKNDILFQIHENSLGFNKELDCKINPLIFDKLNEIIKFIKENNLINLVHYIDTTKFKEYTKLDYFFTNDLNDLNYINYITKDLELKSLYTKIINAYTKVKFIKLNENEALEKAFNKHLVQYNDLNYDLYNNFFKSLIIESNLFNNSIKPNEIMIECTNMDKILKLRKEIIQTIFNINFLLKEDYLILNKILKFVYLMKEYGTLDTIYDSEIKDKFKSTFNLINFTFENNSLENNLKNISRFQNISKLKNINLDIFDEYEKLFKDLEFKLTNLVTNETFSKTITINSLIQNENDLDDYLNLFEKNNDIELNLS